MPGYTETMIANIASHLSKQRCEIIEAFLETLCPKKLISLPQKIDYLNSIKIHFRQCPFSNKEFICSGDAILASVEIKFVQNSTGGFMVFVEFTQECVLKNGTSNI